MSKNTPFGHGSKDYNEERSRKVENFPGELIALNEAPTITQDAFLFDMEISNVRHAANFFEKKFAKIEKKHDQQIIINRYRLSRKLSLFFVK